MLEQEGHKLEMNTDNSDGLNVFSTQEGCDKTRA